LVYQNLFHLVYQNLFIADYTCWGCLFQGEKSEKYRAKPTLFLKNPIVFRKTCERLYYFYHHVHMVGETDIAGAAPCRPEAL
jgi:hypothetical protein